jgi:hypothetical protein
VVGLEQEKIKNAIVRSGRSFKAFILGLRFCFWEIVLGRENFSRNFPEGWEKLGKLRGSCGTICTKNKVQIEEKTL